MPTLQDHTSYVFGQSIDQLDPDVLSKEIDVIRFIVHCFDVSYANVPRMEKKKRDGDVIKIVTGAIEDIWKRKSLPTRSHKAVYLKVKTLVERVEFVKTSKRRHENDAPWIEEVFQAHDKVFDISEKQVNEKLEEAMEIPEEAMEIPEEVVEVVENRKRNAPPPTWLIENMDYEV